MLDYRLKSTAQQTRDILKLILSSNIIHPKREIYA